MDPEEHAPEDELPAHPGPDACCGRAARLPHLDGGRPMAAQDGHLQGPPTH